MDRPPGPSTGRPGAWTGLLILALALALRLFHLGQSSLSTDEGWSVWLASTPSLPGLERFLAEDGVPAADRLSLVAATALDDLAKLVSALARRDYHPPLHYLVLWTARQAGALSEAAVRLPSALFGALACWLVWRLGVLVGGARVGLVAGLLAALSASGVYHSQEARMYALGLALAMGSGLLWVQALESGSLRSCAASGALAWLGALTHYLAGLMVPVALLLLPLSVRRGSPLRPLPAALCLLAPGILALPWLPVVFSQAATRGQLGGALPADYAAYGVFLMGVGVTQELTWPLVWVAALGVAALWIVGARSLGRGPAPPLLLAWTVAPPALAEAASYLAGVRGFAPHHFVIYSGFGWILVAAATTRMLDSDRPARRALAAAILVVLVGLNGWALRNWWTESRFHRGNWRDVASHVRQQRLPGDAVVLQTHYCSYVYGFYEKEPFLAVDGAAQLEEGTEVAPRLWLIQNGAPVTDPEGEVESRVSAVPARVSEWNFPAAQGSEIVRLRLFDRRGEHRTDLPGR